MGKQSVEGSKQKQSALKRLRSALSSAGLTGPKSQVTKKDKKRGVRKATSLKTAERRQKLRDIQNALNPFEMKINRKKLDVLGLRRKDEQVNVSVARQKALERRKTTIGEERRNRSRVGGIVDRRIGENDPSMDPEEKMLMRFTAERQKRARSSGMFNLEEEDVEGDIVSLTHFGKSIDEMDDVDFNGAEDDDEAEGNIEGSQVAAGHFGGFTETTSGPKTKAEIMQEVIAKSKKHKYERQLAKEQDDELRKELDDEFSSIKALLFSKDAADDDGKPMMKAVDSKTVDQSYDTVVKELVFDKRARPQDRLKTEEEVARDELERLEKAERHRKRRMEGLNSDTEVESDSDDDDDMKAYKSESKRRPVADDLGDDFAPAGDEAEREVSLGRGLQQLEDEDEDEDDDEEDEEDDEEDESESDEEAGSGSESDGSEQADLDDVEISRRQFQKMVAISAKSAGRASDELPYTFPAPSDYDAWIELVADYSLDQQIVVIRRLRTLYHIRLSPQNKQKLSDLCIVLTEHLAVLAEQSPPVPVTIVDELVKHIGELAPVDSERFGEHCRQAIVDIHRRIILAIKNSSNSATALLSGPVAHDTGIRASDLALMRLFVSVFSSSDRYHSIITPMLMAVCQYLGQNLFSSLKNIAGGLFLVGLVHESQRLSRRLVPEALNFLYATLAASVCNPDDPSDWDGQYPLSRRHRLALQTLRIGATDKCQAKTVEPIGWSWLVSEDQTVSVDSKYAVLRASLQLSRRYIDCYFSQPAFIELFAPLHLVLKKISERLPKFKHQQAPSEVIQLLNDLRVYLDEQLQQSQVSRIPLKMQSHKPLAIDSVAPMFEANYSLDTHYDPDRSRNESIKLRRQVNREKRGAVRELRRDAQFIAGEKLKEQREKDKSYKDKMKKAWSVLEDDQSQLKKLDRMRIRESKAKV
ncbi:nucleolar complex protein 14 [Coemansia sp. RSA 1286]|nr:nucleolar complex protein 14 [Coemansia sp. RSA 1286]